MVEFEVHDMSCGHCVAAITRAVKALDAGAEVLVDLAGHRVQVTSPILGIEAVAGAIRGAGHTPVRSGDRTVGG